MLKSSAFQIPFSRLSKILFFCVITGQLAIGNWHSLYALTFDDLVAGAHTGGLGGSFAALAEGPQSQFINPAGLSDLDTPYIYSGMGHYYSLPASNYHFSYLKPIYRGIVLGGAWQGSDSLLKKFDRFYLTWAEASAFPGIPKDKHKFSWAANLRALSLSERPTADDSFDSDLGLGIDIGFKLKFPDSQTQFGASVIGLDTMISKVNGPMLNLGALKKYGIFSGMVDFRARQYLKTFYPAVQTELFQGLAYARAGRGIRLGESRTVALGFGAALSPLTVDTAIALPYEGLHRREGAVMVSIGYALGGKRFYERFTGRAAAQAQELSQKVIELEKAKKKLSQELKNAQSDLNVLREEIDVLDDRKRQDQAQQELERLKEEQSKETTAQEQEQLKPKPVAEWPKRHRVINGDTLRRVATTYYGDPEYWEKIYKSNSEKIERGLPKVGEILEIPDPNK